MKSGKVKLLIICFIAALLMVNILSACSPESDGKAATTAGEKPAADKTQPGETTDTAGTADEAADGATAADGTTAADGATTADGAKAADGAATAVPSAQEESSAEEGGKMNGIPIFDFEKKTIPDNKALSFVKDMKIGWNLGNTFDAIDCKWLTDELDYESGWCGIKTSEEMIRTVKEAGFNAVRIPVSWHNHVSGDDYIISEAWLGRVQQVVDYAIGNGMYVIINIHHDMSNKYVYTSSEHEKQSSSYVKHIWSQVAKRFADYDEHLIFESLNEPRMVGSKYEWWLDANDKSCKDAVASLNAINQVFVDTVRASGGNNKERYLLTPGYGASYGGALDPGFKLPTDKVNDKLIVSVHAYTPYNFALQDPGGTNRFDPKKAESVREIDYFMDELYNKFVSAGIPVLIGEFGARNKKDNLKDRIDYSAYYTAAAKARGITCFWWDNNAFTGDGELFGLFDRASLTWPYPEIVEALMKNAW